VTSGGAPAADDGAGVRVAAGGGEGDAPGAGDTCAKTIVLEITKTTKAITEINIKNNLSVINFRGLILSSWIVIQIFFFNKSYFIEGVIEANPPFKFISFRL
jgi:hypothetical protein